MLESADYTRAETRAPFPGGARFPVGRAAPYSVATELPSHRLSTAELAERYDLSEEWIVSRTGVRERPIAGPEERLSDFATRASLAALERAGVEASEVDLVLAATLTQDELTPNTAPLVAHAIGAYHAGAIDVGAACTAWLSAAAIAAAQIETGRCRWALVIGADFISRLVDWEDKRSAPLFADAAGAVLFGPAGDGPGGVGPIVLGADGSEEAQALVIHHHDRKIRMSGPEVYRNAVARMAESTLQAVERAGMTLQDIDLFVYHQANGRITRALGERLGLDPAKVVDCIEKYGNSSAGTLPLGLATAEADGRLKPGTRVLLGAFGGGFTWGGGVIEWGGSREH
ncbi:MAG TPA: beta-ketoacyl-ACP synthase 3 [Solirubrobacteraceae bacterium]|nr:beta-ketoacyl-ACP synthase 3 [Solirubrobacteraceae bacterium]